jgi:hypothetical protein
VRIAAIVTSGGNTKRYQPAWASTRSYENHVTLANVRWRRWYAMTIESQRCLLLRWYPCGEALPQMQRTGQGWYRLYSTSFGIVTCTSRIQESGVCAL